MSMILRLILNTLALLFTVYILQALGMGIQIQTFWWALLAALILGVFNTLVRPILILLTLPLSIITLGLFALVINAFLFWLVGVILHVGFSIDTFWTALVASLVYSILTTIIARLLAK